MKTLFVSAVIAGATALPAIAQQTTPTSTNTAQQVQTQDTVWIQLEALGSLRGGEDRAQFYAGQIDGVSGFRVGGNWYAVLLGPYTQQAADQQLRDLRAQGLIPRDSFLVRPTLFRQQFWPVGTDSLAQAPTDVAAPAVEAPAAVAAPATTPVAAAQPEPQAPVEPEAPREETKREALKSERALNREERRELQRALQFGGFYTTRIDGAFGPGTRRAMAAWQTDRGYDATGVLTTNQRAEALGERQAFIDSLGMAPYQDANAGISIDLPSAMVKFDRYEAPFAHFASKADSGARVVLISQTGNQDTLFGLYDILQTLEIVPPEGPRTRKDREFTLVGEDDKIISHTFARLIDGTVKGFTLIWPKDDEQRRTMALDAMKGSFKSLGATALADNAGLDAAVQSIDLVSGLEIRRPDAAASGFYVTGNGAILTTKNAVESCGRITIDDEVDAKIVAVDDALGLALLKPDAPLAPMAHAAFLATKPRLKSEISVAGYSFDGRLGAPSISFGTMADAKGLNGETNLSRLDVSANASDAGGPVMDAGGAVVGVLLPNAKSGRQLPENVSFSVDGNTAADFLSANGISAQTTNAVASMDPVDLTAMAVDMTVLVSCWK